LDEPLESTISTRIYFFPFRPLSLMEEHQQPTNIPDSPSASRPRRNSYAAQSSSGDSQNTAPEIIIEPDVCYSSFPHF
jgi:hypothetical protein